MPNEAANTPGPANPDRPASWQFCTACGSRLESQDRFCPTCGADIQRQVALRKATIAQDGPEPGDPLPGHEPAPLPVAQRRRVRRRRRWYKRPLVLIPVAILAVLAIIGGVAAYKTYTAFDNVHSVSTPPPEISGAALGGDEDLIIDTGPAQQAMRDHEEAQAQATEQAERGEVPATETADTNDPSATGPASDAGEPGSTQGPTPPASELPGGTASPESGQLAALPPDNADGTTNILLMGVDAREGEAIDVGVRPDSLGILNLNEATGTCRILAVPRDSRVTIPGYGQSKVNHALAVGGIPFEQLVLEQYLGIQIDHYALVDFSGLVAVVDAVGGVTIDNPEAFQVGDHTFAQGELHLNGDQALMYARYRGGADGDFGRVSKQQRIIRALLDEANDANLVRLVPDMFNLLQDHFRTDFGVVGLIDLANEYRDKCTSGTLETRTIPGDVATMFDDMMQMNLSFVVADPAEVTAHVEWLLQGEQGETPASSPAPATPVATPAATPATAAPEATARSRRRRRQAQEGSPDPRVADRPRRKSRST